MNSSVLFGTDEIESLTIGDECLYFVVSDHGSLWSVGDDDDNNDELSDLGIYNIP